MESVQEHRPLRHAETSNLSSQEVQDFRTADTIKHAFNSNGQGAVISASRSVLYAFRSEKWSKDFAEVEYAQAARAKAEDMREKINQVRF